MARTSRLDEIRVSVTPSLPFAYGDTLTFNLPPEAQERIKLLFLEVIGEDEPGKLLLDIGSEFATPRDYKRSARNHFREHLRQLVEAL